jgi:LysM repeat protein
MTFPADAADASTDATPRPGDDLPSDPAGPARPRPSGHWNAAEISAAECPYLVSAGGSWRQAAPSRDHRCSGVEPAATLTTDKQRQHCLAPDHVFCPTFRAARTARAAILSPGSDAAHVAAADAARRPLARTAPVVLEPPRLVDQAVRLQFERAPGQVALIALMALAFIVVAVARLSAGAAPDPSGQPTGPAASSSAVAGPTRSVAPTPTASPRASVAPSGSAAPSAVAASSFRTTYTVKKNDTLSGIASQFGTTADELSKLNGLPDNRLKVGQVLKIP